MTIPDHVVQALTDLLGEENVRCNERVARYTTWRVGGPAALLCIAHSAEALGRCVEIIRDAAPCVTHAPLPPRRGSMDSAPDGERLSMGMHGHAPGAALPWLAIGRGSNVLLDDAGFDGAIIVNRAGGLTIDGTDVWAESGVLLSVLARRTVAAGLVGLEWCHDIPGSVGGAIVNNAGANGGCMADVLRCARVLPPVEGAIREVDAGELAFGYRRSALRSEDMIPVSARPLVLAAHFQLRRGEVTEIKQRMDAQRARRKATQPGGASAGSVFKNPAGDSAGRLIESLGLKGARRGDATISTLHANFIVNGPRATAADVLSLIALVRRRVRDACGIDLEPEVQFVRRDGCIGPPREEDI